MRNYTRAAGIASADKLVPHSTRHTVAKRLLARGYPLSDVQDLLGHDDPRTTQVYNANLGLLDRSLAHNLGQMLHDLTVADRLAQSSPREPATGDDNERTAGRKEIN